MANPTTNFGWVMPTSTDLVTDLPADFAIFGQAVDTSMAELKGGTTGQVLSKTSNTDMDFTWVAQDDSNAIQNAIVDAKGDLIAASAADTPARLAVGANGETLVANSAASTGLSYQGNFAAGKNKVINGNFDVWQRGTTSAAVANGTFLADRWRAILVGTSLNATYSRDTSVPSGASLYSAKLQQLTSSATSVTEFGLHQIFEVGTATNFAGKTVTASFWYRSNKTGSHYVRVYTVNATGGTDVTTAFTVNAANTWEYKTINFSSYAAVTAFTGALTDNGGAIQIGINLYPTASMTVSTNDYFQISQVQLEAGSVATAFQTATGTLQGELAACQRYYYRVTGDGTTTYQNLGVNGNASSTAACQYPVLLPVTMRTKPSAVDYSSLAITLAGTTSYAITTLTMPESAPSAVL